MRSSKQKGFTVIELMISTAVFSMILLVVLGAITQIGRMYYKGIVSTKTQEVTRALVDRISQGIQYGASGTGQIGELVITPSPPATAPTIYCVGKSRYFLYLDKTTTATEHALWGDTGDDCVTGSATILPSYNSSGVASPTTGKNGVDLIQV
jgi:prepilin-type N-terminal cleavage/methylation domain-containing protein